MADGWETARRLDRPPVLEVRLATTVVLSFYRKCLKILLSIYIEGKCTSLWILLSQV